MPQTRILTELLVKVTEKSKTSFSNFAQSKFKHFILNFCISSGKATEIDFNRCCKNAHCYLVKNVKAFLPLITVCKNTSTPFCSFLCRCHQNAFTECLRRPSMGAFLTNILIFWICYCEPVEVRFRHKQSLLSLGSNLLVKLLESHLGFSHWDLFSSFQYDKGSKVSKQRIPTLYGKVSLYSRPPVRVVEI